MIIDFHVHAWADRLAQNTIKLLEERASTVPLTDGTLLGTKEYLKQNNIDIAVIANIATKPSHIRVLNKWAADHNTLPFVQFGSIHPEAEDVLEELDRIKASGLKGIKLHPDYQGFFVNEDRMLPIYEKISSLGLIVLFHSGLDIGLGLPHHCTPKMLQEVLPSLNGATVIAAHMGGYTLWDETEEYLCGHNIYLDTAYTGGRIDDEQLLRIVKSHGADKILLASDLPWDSPIKQAEIIRSLPISTTEKDMILYKNAARILGL